MADITNALNEFKTAPNGESVRDAFVETMTLVNNDNIKIAGEYSEIKTVAGQLQPAVTTATNAATLATQKATEASNAATTASTKAGEATIASNTATTKASEAISAKDIASTKAGEAATSAATVVGIRDEILPKLNNIDQKVTDATSAATSAQASKDIAVTKAGEAAASATAASTQAGIATTSATTATTKASEAAASATAAETFAANAEAAVGVTAEERNTWNAKQNALGFTPEDSANKGVANGYAALDTNGKIPSSQLPVIAEHSHANKAILDKITVGTAVSYDLDSFGDMKKSVYDSTGNGVVDNAEKVNGLTVQTAVPLNAIFTDTVYTPPSTYSADIITDGTTNKVFTATLKTKLDSVEAGATADQTSEEILTSIKSVDGAGSGLDADLLDGQHASEFALTVHGTHVIYGDTTTTLTSGGIGVVGVSDNVAREDHTHTLPTYPDLSGHVSSPGLHVTTEKQTEWNKNTTDIVLLQQQSGTLGANDSAVRREVIDIKLKLDEMNVVEYLNKTGIGFFDLFEDSSNIDAGSTTAVMASTDVTFTGTQVLQMNSQNFSDFTNVELAIYDLLREQFLVTVAVSNSPTISMDITPGSRTIGEKFYYNGEVYTITNVVAS